MSSPKKIKKILQENNIAVLKKFGQNFLISETILNKILETANIKPTDTILEIGPGLGVLTFELAKRAGKVIAVEKDRKMAEILQKNLAQKGISNVEVINQDILKFQETRNPEGEQAPYGAGKKQTNSKSQIQNYKLVANLPYNIATAVIMKFLESENPPQQIVVMIQKEVAQRIVATPPHMNKLAIFCQLYSEPKIVAYVPPTAFWPKPKVDSAILEFKELKLPSYLQSIASSSATSSSLAPLVNIGFSHPRKTLLNNLVRGLTPTVGVRPLRVSKEKISQWLLKNNLQPNQRPETLSIHNWLCLAKTYKTFHNN